MERQFGGRHTLSPNDKTGVEGSRSSDMPDFLDSSVKARLQTDVFSRKASFVNHLTQDISPDMDVNLMRYV